MGNAGTSVAAPASFRFQRGNASFFSAILFCESRAAQVAFPLVIFSAKTF